jgi:hypothetical protein
LPVPRPLSCLSHDRCLACPTTVVLPVPRPLSCPSLRLSCLSLEPVPGACPRGFPALPADVLASVVLPVLACWSSRVVLACWSRACLACPAPVVPRPLVPRPLSCLSFHRRSLRLAVPRVARCLAGPDTWVCARLACPESSPGSGLTAIHNRRNLPPNNGLRPIASSGACTVAAPKLQRQISGNLAVFSAIATDVGRSISLTSSSRAATTLGRRSPASPLGSPI